MESRERARVLRKRGWSWRMIAREVGVSHTTVRRWLNPDFCARERLATQARKRAYLGSCVECGAVTRYAGHENLVSLRCIACGHKQSGRTMQGRGRVVGDILTLLSHGDLRISELASHLGANYNVTNVALQRLLKYGLVERPERGLYRLVRVDF